MARQTSLTTGPGAIAPPEEMRPIVRVRCSGCGNAGRYRAGAIMTLGRLESFCGPGPHGYGCPACGRDGWHGVAAGREDRASALDGEVINGTTSAPWEAEERAKVNGPEWDTMPVQPCPWPDRWICSCVRDIPEGTTELGGECASDPAALRRCKEGARNLDRRDGPVNGLPALPGWARPVYAIPAAPEARAERIDRARALTAELRAARKPVPATPKMTREAAAAWRLADDPGEPTQAPGPLTLF